ncbi:amino acid ABC transporter permease [Palleronia sp. LCG004]|uniref:amino acid ABC transporter permease n=1 Tax=Palleronia sp. LCG004 TaxID=3079304 RepID=UPI0029421A75|nr:amino acid ABC transporter permease [Palleronia sp. LCG004]WOI56832.1 amino acid ABC transporter permease [Palleronia sp. LCG004]
MTLDFYHLIPYAPALAWGFVLTVLAWAASLVLSLIVGSVLGLVAALTRGPVRMAIAAYVGFFRGTPLLIQLFILYYGGPHLGLTLDAWQAGLLGLTLYGGAYATEIVRGGLQAIPRGQIEAARALGYTRWKTLRHIVTPQVLVPVMPPMTNNAIFLLKDTALLSVITVPEMTSQVSKMNIETFTFVEPYLALSITYWILVEFAARMGRLIEARITRHLEVRS